ncbi:MAG: hypothetical protein H8K03_12530 [Nitrospira sp.]|nr:hypothetical protein [Nitrospira sp. BO4]
MNRHLHVPQNDNAIRVEIFEPSMEMQVIQNAEPEIGVAARKMGCTHQRLIADVLTRSGKRTGKVRCLECCTEIDDPYLSQK